MKGMLMSKWKMLLIVSIVFFLSCENTNKDSVQKQKEEQERELLISDIIKEGNIESYNSFIFNYHDDIKCIPLSIYMIEKYNYGHACYQMFSYFCNLFEYDSLILDSASKEYLLYYLKKGVDLEDTTCIWAMSNLYISGIYVEKDTVLAKKYIMRIFSKDDVDSFVWPYLKRNNFVSSCQTDIDICKSSQDG